MSVKKIFRVLSGGERRAFAAAALAAIVSAAVLSVLLFREFTVVTPSHGGEYREGMIGQPIFINPVLASQEIDQNLIGLFFSNLEDLTDVIAPEEDGRIWTIRLKEGLRWSDGRKFTSDDVIFTVEKIQDPASQSPLFLSWQGARAERLSELELRFTLVAPYAFFRYNLRGLFIIPKHLFADVPVANWRLSEYNLEPVGNGPYHFDSYEREPNGFVRSLHLKTNPFFFRAQPFIEHVSVEFFTDPDELVLAFNRGQIDGFAGDDYELLDTIVRPHDTHAFSLPHYYAVFMNGSQHLALKEFAVRNALLAAIDPPHVLNEALGGQGKILRDPIAPELQEKLGLAALPEPSLPEALALLEKSGWKINADGIREKTIRDTAILLEFNLVVPKIPFLVRSARTLEEQWKAIGARIRVEIIPVEEIVDQVIKNRDYHALLFGNFLNPPLDLYPFWHSQERFYPGLNLSLYQNKEVDRLIELVRKSDDDASQKEQLDKLRSAITNDAPAVFLYAPDYLMITRKDLFGIRPSFIEEPWGRFRGINEWFVKTARVLKS